MPAARQFFVADRQDRWPVHSEGGNRRASSRGQADRNNVVPTEVRRPVLAARMKELHNASRLRIPGGSARFLSKRTRDACKRQIVERGSPANHFRHDMVYVEGGLLSDLSKAAVLAAAIGACDDEPA